MPTRRPRYGPDHCEYQDAGPRAARREPDAVRIRRAWDSPDGPGVGLDPIRERLSIVALYGRHHRASVVETTGDGLCRREVTHSSYFVTVIDDPASVVFEGKGRIVFVVEA